MLCGVTATLGSNPSATATAARPQWGRAVLLCPNAARVGCMWRRWCCWVAPLVFRAPEGPAAREARASLRSAPRLEARPCPPVPPAPSTPVGPGVLTCGWVRRLVVRPGLDVAHGRCGQTLWPAVPSASGWGFALHGAFRVCVVGVSEPRVAQFPPFGCRVSAAGGGVVPKVQTTSVKDAENGLLWAKWSTFWAQVCLLWVAARVQTRYCEHSPAMSHVSPLAGVSAWLTMFA